MPKKKVKSIVTKNITKKPSQKKPETKLKNPATGYLPGKKATCGDY